MKLPQFAIDDLIKRAIAEDINYIDVTTDYLLDEDAQSTASFIAKDTGVLAGSGYRPAGVHPAGRFHQLSGV